MESNLSIIQDLYRHFANKDTEKIRALFDENIEWSQMEGFPNGGHYIGFDQIQANVFQGFSDHWTGWKAEVSDFIDAENDIIAVGTYSGTYNNTGKFVEAAFIHHYQVVEGKVKKFVQYTDTHLIAEAMT